MADPCHGSWHPAYQPSSNSVTLGVFELAAKGWEKKLLEVPLGVMSGLGVGLNPAVIAPFGFTTICEEPSILPSFSLDFGFITLPSSPFLSSPLHPPLLPVSPLSLWSRAKGTLELMGSSPLLTLLHGC